MPVILLAHRDPQLRASLGSALTARGFEVIGVDSVDTALDAAAAGATGLLVELALLADEDLEVKTRLDLRSGRPTRILALTHKASAAEMSMLKRHGAGLLARPIEDVERMASMLRISEEAPAPWDGAGAAPAPVAPPAQPSKGGTKAAKKGAKAAPSGVNIPPPAPRPPPPPALVTPPPPGPVPAAPPITGASIPPPSAQPMIVERNSSSAPWEAMSDAGAPPPISPPASPSAPVFKPAPANFMPPDLSKSFPAAPPPPAQSPRPLPPPPGLVPPALGGEPVTPPPSAPPLPPPPSVAPRAPARSVNAAIAEILDEEEEVKRAAPTPPPGLRKAAPVTGPSGNLDDGPTTVAQPDFALPPATPPPVAAPPKPSFDLSSPEAPSPPATAPPPPPVFAPPPPSVSAVPTAPAPPPPPKANAGPLSWGDETEDEMPPPKFDTNVFLDEPEEKTNKVDIGGARPPSDTLPRRVNVEVEEESRRTAMSPVKAAPKVEVEAEPGSTGTFALLPNKPADALAPAPAKPAVPPPEEGTQVIRELADTPMAPPVAAAPFTPPDTSISVPDLSSISANMSEAWFAEGNGKEAQKAADASGPSVLVVDDEPAFRMFLKDALGSQGYRVHTAINGPNALRFVKSNPAIDLVISDLHMPHMDGFELKHEIDKLLGRSMPFIVCTADASDDKIQTAAHVGASALVPKPIENLDAFFAIVTDTLRDAGVIAKTA